MQWRKNFSMTEGVLDYKIMHYLPGAIMRYADQTGFSGILRDGVIIYRNQGAAAYFPSDQIRAYIEAILKRIKTDQNWVRSVHDSCRHANEKYFTYAREILTRDVTKMTPAQIIEINRKLIDLQIEGHLIAVSTTWFVDSDGELFSTYLLERMKDELAGRSAEDIMRAFSILTTPTEQSIAEQEELDFLELAKKVEEDPEAKRVFGSKQNIEARFETVPPAIRSSINEHCHKWRWTPYTYTGPAYRREHYLYELVDLFDSGQHIQSALRETKERRSVLKKKQEDLLGRLPLSADTRRLLATAREIIWLKDFRKYALFHGLSVTDLLHKEAAKRLSLTLSQVNHLTPDEFEQALLTGAADSHTANERAILSVLSYISGVQQILTGDRAERLYASLEYEEDETAGEAELTGTCACPGEVAGAVKIVNSVADMDKMNDGDIMVAHTTFPSLLPAMRKAGAIITEDGGVTCHAAIVSRELNIPCVVGVRNATHLLTDGERVRVDATAGRVEKEKLEEIVS